MRSDVPMTRRAVTRQIPRADPRARRVMTENVFYVIYALRLVADKSAACQVCVGISETGLDALT